MARKSGSVKTDNLLRQSKGFNGFQKDAESTRPPRTSRGAALKVKDFNKSVLNGGEKISVLSGM